MRAEQILRTTAEDEKRTHPQLRHTAEVWVRDFEAAMVEPEDGTEQ
jgi:hypothetical protein